MKVDTHFSFYGCCTMSAPHPRYLPLDRTTCSTVSLDQQLPAEHPARTIWQFTLGLDLSAFDADVKAVEGHPGRPAHCPQLLFALWLYARTDGVCLARELARRCTRDLPYQWLCGGQSPDYHTLSDFHAQHADRLRQLFVDHVAALRSQGLIALRRVAIDGTKRPADAGNATYHRAPTLQRHLQEAARHVQDWERGRLQTARLTARQRAARQRAARERQARLQRAVAKVHERQRQRQHHPHPDAAPAEARASEADPDAVRMKQGDGGFRLSYNVQTVTDAAHGLIVTTAVINQGNDSGQLATQVQRVADEQGTRPAEALVDSGYATVEDIEAVEASGVQVIMPPRDAKKDQRAGRDPYAPKRRDGAAVAAWRARMGTAAAQALYRQRSGLAEIIHARMGQRKWWRFRLRGLVKAGVEALWQAWAHNVSRLLALGKLLRAGTVRAALA
jgi:transposase